VDLYQIKFLAVFFYPIDIAPANSFEIQSECLLFIQYFYDISNPNASLSILLSSQTSF